MKKLICFLVVIGSVYGLVGNTLVQAGTTSINSTQERMLKAGV